MVFTAFTLGCVGIIVYVLTDIDETARHIRLKEQLRQVQEFVRIDGSNNVTVALPGHDAPLYQSNDPQRFYALTTPEGCLLATSSEPLARQLFAHTESGLFADHEKIVHLGTGDTSNYFLSRPVSVSNETFALTVGHRAWTSDRILQEAERKLLRRTALWAVVAGFLVCLVSVVVIRSSFSPLRSLARQAGDIGPSNPGLRLAHADLSQELSGLVDAANAATNRLEQASLNQRRFTADAAHQLLTPLAVLSARIDQEGDLECRAGLRGDINRMKHLIRQLLNLARIEAAAEPLQLLDLRVIAKEVVQAMAPLAIQQGKMLSFNDCPGACRAEGAGFAIQDALCNLVQNALQHTGPGGEVEVSLLQPATISVSDRGPGIADEQAERLFQPFFTTRESLGGSGLGLAIVARVMSQHGGSIHAANRPGGGAEFRMSFA